MNLKILVPLVLLGPINLISQTNNSYPVNSSTGLISISNVIPVKGKSRSSLKEMAVSYFSSKNSTAILTENENNHQKKMKEVPKFTGGQTMSSDSLVIFQLTYKIYIEPRLFSTNISASNDDFVDLSLSFFIKDEKIKYELTNFKHRRFKAGFDAGGGAFENERPDWNDLSGKKRWKVYRDAGIERAKLLAKDIEQYFNSEHKSQFDF